MDREEILLKEYEVCQSHNNSLGSQAWVSISILVTVNVLLIGQVVVNIVLKSVPIVGCSKLVLVILIALVMIMILWIFKRWDKRIDFMVLLNNERMRHIETTLGMWKNWRVYGLDLKYGYGTKEDWDVLLPTQRKTIEQFSKRYQLLPWYKKGKLRYEPPTTKGEFWKLRWKFDWIFHILIGFWIVTMVLELLIYYCDFVRCCLFN